MEPNISNTNQIKTANNSLNLMQIIGIIVGFFIVVISLSFLNEKQDFYFYPWYYEYLVYFLIFFLIILTYKPARSYLFQLISSIKFNKPKDYVFIILSWIFLMCYLAVLNIITQQLHMTPDPPKMIYNPSEMQLLIYGIGLVLLAPIWEEFLFRGILFSRLKNYIPICACFIISSLAFTCIHPISFGNSLYIFVFGLLVAYSYYKTNNMFVPISIHLLNNLFSLSIAMQ
ncbi:CPBP family intramembrane glutamic endopeptidase [Bacillus thuringiensis]|uniref:CAAX prenyl protease 2/Lysostaphin resistance protein A-like domain-containing protein n=1 Tax=Bacillus thuringiensis subsp. jegathesan TaxID=56955 RepID=A0A9X6MJF4_BACTJ|nr:CPBP family intramembrane glutamic endopeptidase [Bacillus thuringiensis]OUB77079.1 hypothetical protein BK750_02740 [Bacillus thuringiensis serovar jegathesan]